MAMIQFDYDSVKNRLTDRLQRKMNGRILPNSTAMRLIEAWSEEFDRVAAYNEYLTRETKWSIAQNASSILTQLELFGYKPHRKKGASGTVWVSSDENFVNKHSVNILIPKFTRFSDGNFTYCSTEDVVLSNISSSVEVPVIQGELKTTGEFLGNSFSGDVYTIENADIENTLYELKNNNIVCTEVDWFGQTQVSVNNTETGTYTYNNFEYKIKNLSDFSGIQIQFAPNSHDANDHFEFRYLVTEGENGSCFACWSEDTPKNGITKVLNSVTDVQGVSVKLYVRNTKEISGGTNYETTEDMRANAPYSFNRVDKIITHNDYIAAIKEILPDSIFQIWTEASLKREDEVFDIEDAKDFINNSKVFFSGVRYDVLRRTVTPLESAELHTAISEKINDKKGVTDYFIIDDPEVWKFYINGKVYYNLNKTTPSLVMSQVSDSILAKYRVSKAQFNTPAYRSDYISVFSGIQGVDHVDVNAVMYTQIFLDKPASTTVCTVKKSIFGFIPSVSDEIEIDGEYIFASVKNTTGELVQDLFILKYADGGWNFYSAEKVPRKLSNGTSSDAVKWKTTAGDMPDELMEIEINFSVSDGKLIWYGDSSATSKETAAEDSLCKDNIDLVCRFVPTNFNCTLTAKDQILIYSDSTGDSGVLDPWMKTVVGGEEIRAGKNWWATDAEILAGNALDKYGAGLVFIGN